MLFRKKLVLLFVVAFMAMGIMSGITAFAAEDNIEVVFTDVTATDETTLLGEAKIKVSVKGAGGKVSIAQVALAFESDKGFEFAVSHLDSLMLMRAMHTDEIVPAGKTIVRIDYKGSGIGSNSCGPALDEKYRLSEKNIAYGFTLTL